MSSLREKILTTASALFQTQGINSTGVDTIVAVAGTTKMTLYKYFGSKETLILEVLKQGHQDFQSWLNHKLSTNTKKPAEKIQKLFDYIEEWVTSPDFQGVGFIKASAEFPKEENPVHQLSSEQSLQFRQYISHLATEANIQDADGLALQLSLLFEGAVQAEQMKRGSGAMKYAKTAAKILIDGALTH
ncbi:MAG: TetR/AcrR family transcriptional regulator [Methylotenera sp.]|nr:TetR/AcrR family transcriptional regulator [Methylotenera sp.]MDP1960496.1 TetR/AcrR family transcriptional regulator [Methylotenera sp.]MDP3206311.1 TetR/AcrR family transcriptional regulator [Methylotenera sp.]MDP3303862.1 TetR/AcrR family transcriptional regulator [Methylotenera sp.]MDP3943783.1 TetR/AcrR family transcriptional regulator [Methylotenera sp.]